MTRLQIALNQLRIVRGYTVEILETVPESDWFRQPSEGVTHLAWQVGHMAIAEHSLALVRIRGTQPQDTEIIPDSFSKLFGKGSTPVADSGAYPAPAEIRSAFDKVHEQALLELASLPDADLDTKLERPHRVFDTKLGSILWCAQHEMLHTGQIGLLRRLFQSEPMW